MALATSSQTIDLEHVLVTNTDVDNTADLDLMGGACKLYNIEIDNTTGGGSAAEAFVKLYDSGTVTVGTTDPVYIFIAPSNKIVQYTIPDGATFAAALSIAATQTSGTAGTTDVSHTLKAKLLCEKT